MARNGEKNRREKKSKSMENVVKLSWEVRESEGTGKARKIVNVSMLACSL